MAALAFAVAIGAAVVAAVPASALSADEDGRSAARHAFAEAEEAFSAREYERALQLFRQAYSASPHPAVRFNIGVCLERLGRFREAREEYLAAAQEPNLSAREQKQALQSAARLARHLGWLDLEATDPGGVATVDGTRSCALPCRLPVDAGRHTVLVRLGTTEIESVVELRPGERQRLRYGEARPASGPAPPSTGTAPAAQPHPPRATAPAPAPWAAAAAGSSAAPADERPAAHGPGLLTWGGTGIGLLGLAGVIGFGGRALWLHDRYLQVPTAATRDEGILMRDLANASIGVAAIGALLIGADVIWLAVAAE